MSSPVARAPELVPQLSRGKHRTPRKGACFMELASYLAGERWSDHPSCTHPLLAGLARLVNDHTSDGTRSQLALLVPSVVGLNSDDPEVDLDITLRAATTALPIAAMSRQRVLAVSVLAAERMRGDLRGAPALPLEARTRQALDAAPDAERWARGFSRDIRLSLQGFRRHAAPNAVRHAVMGIVESHISDPDTVLRDLLAGSISDIEARTGRPASTEAGGGANPVTHLPGTTGDGGAPGASAWADLCRLTGVTTP